MLIIKKKHLVFLKTHLYTFANKTQAEDVDTETIYLCKKERV